MNRLLTLLTRLLSALAVWRPKGARPVQPRAKTRSRLPFLPGGKPAPYDLANDDSTKNQRYLM